ncbi:hypothetical protein [Arthrobacter sp. H-02-3]|uniref:hypothetical protein n=1 Tax=Arthrobacter sp. H-02-3 TaxID=2703675 RepID=UPI000DD1D351|nr:hypothetical protein [Arthrobacter sp. H-02-3]PVZ52604.1 hypothetical protein C9424_19885 [Arthrobacter sp. H-02-3]
MNKAIRFAAAGAVTALSLAGLAMPAHAASTPSSPYDACGPVANSIKPCTALDGWIYQMSVNKDLTGPPPGIGGALVDGNSLTVYDGAWNPADATLTHQWLRNGVPVPGANGTTYKLTAADIGNGIRVQTTATAAGYAASTVESATSAPVTAAGDDSLPTVTPPSRVSITGVGGMYGYLYAKTYTWITPGILFAYQWTRDGVPIPGDTGVSHRNTSADGGKRIRVAVTGYAPGYEPVTLTSFATSVGGAWPQGAPIAGTPEPGQVLTAGQPVTEDSGTTLQWLRDGIEITGATTNTYTVTDTDRGSVLVMRTSTTPTWDNPGITYTRQLQVPGAPAEQLPLTNVSLPVLDGEARMNKPVSVTPGTWSVPNDQLTISYRWSVNGQLLRDSDKATYTPDVGLLGRTLSVTVAASAPGYQTTKVTVTAPSRVAEPDPELVHGAWFASYPVIGVPFKVYDPFFDSRIDDQDLKNTYQWLRAGTPIRGATGQAYTPVGADAGQTLSVAVSTAYKGRIFRTQTVTALRPVPLRKLATAMPTVTGTPKAGSVLRAKHGAWTKGTVFTYQWLRNGIPISNATASTYKVRTADKGKRLTVRVTGTQAGYKTAARGSFALLAR